MKGFIFFLVSLLVTGMYAQANFNMSYDFETLASGFSSIECDNDTVVIYGVIISPETESTGLLFTKIDSSGNIISSSTYFDKDGDNFTRPYQNSLIKLSNKTGYVAAGQLFGKSNGYIINFDNAGNVINYKEHLDTLYEFNHFKEIIEVSNNSFLIIGNKAYIDQDYSIGFIMKIDISGEILWETRIADSSNAIFLSSIVEVDSNRFIIGGLKTDRGNVSTFERKYSSLILQIDSVGDVKSTWYGEKSLEECGVGNMELTPFHGIIYNSLKGEYNNTYDQLFTQPILIERDSSFNLLVRDTFGTPQGSTYNIANIHYLNNGDWLTVGVKPLKYPLPPNSESINSLSGWINRFDVNGNNLWTVTDTSFWSNQTGSNNILYDAVELSSGSIIACGYNRTNEPKPKDWGWLLKVSKDGCIDTFGCDIVNVKSIVDFDIEVYPNPAFDLLVFSSKNPNLNLTALSIYDINGSQVANFKDVSLITLFQWNCDALPRGIYFYRLLTSIGYFVTGKVVLI